MFRYLVPLRRGRQAAEDEPAVVPEVESETPAVSPLPRPAASRTRLRGDDDRLRIAPGVLAQIEATIGSLPPETGGVLGVDRDGVISAFRFDHVAATTMATYAPTISMVNAERRHLEARGGNFCGFVHSHPSRMARVSHYDLSYAQELLQKAKVDEIALPIVVPREHGRPAVIAWYVARPGNGAAEAVPVEITVVERAQPERHDRVHGACDVDRLAGCRVVAIGCGGARSAIEELVRCGLRELVLIDPDEVEPQNLATQHVFADEIGRPKVEALRESCLRIDPDARIVALQARIEDVPLEQLELLARAPWLDGASKRTLFGLWTDDFLANGYGHRVALQLGLPAVWASLHLRGASGEVGLVAPGDTATCMRCALARRYAHYLQGGANDATSAAAPLWATSRLNALKVAVTLAALHAAGPDDAALSPERSLQDALYRRIVESPLAVLRLSPDARMLTGVGFHDSVFAGAARPEALVFDETVWRRPSPHPGCPDCGGSGDLLAARGRLRNPDPAARRRWGLR